MDDPRFTGPVRQGHVVIAWHVDVGYQQVPRHYGNWKTAQDDAERQLRIGGLRGRFIWVPGHWNDFPALHLEMDSRYIPYLLIEQPLIRDDIVRDVHYAETEELTRT